MADKPLRIALSGYYGCGNTGDEAVLAGIVESFRIRAGEGAASFTVLSADPADTKRRHGLAAVDRMRFPIVRETLRASDLLISGGGSLLQDTTSVRSLVYYLAIVRMGLKAGVPVMFYAQGIGPLRRPISKVLTKMVANRVSCITVRDTASRDLLKGIGVNKPPIEVTADPAYALRAPSPERISEIRERAGIKDEQTVGFALRRWGVPGSPGPDLFAEAADRIVEQTGSKIVFIPMQPPDDLNYSNDVANLMKQRGRAVVVDEPLSPQETLGLVGSLNALAAMRLHALIFAAAAGGVPITAFSYDPKVTQLMKGLGQDAYNIELSSFTPSEASQRVASALHQDSEMLRRLREASSNMTKLALSNVDFALQAARG